MAQVRIRWAKETDAAKIVYFIRELARFEREPPERVKITEADVRRDGFGPRRRFETLIAELDSQAQGFALFFPNYSTWEGKPGLYLEDIFVEESARKTGLGRALIAALAAVAKSRGCVRIDLSVLEWNPARSFYRRLGFRHVDVWQTFRLGGAELDNLAASASPIGDGWAPSS